MYVNINGRAGWNNLACLDSGCSKRPVFNSPAYFPNGWDTAHGIEIEVADGHKHKPTGVGTASCVVCDVDGKPHVWSFADSIYDPKAPCNLFCVDRFHFDKDGNETDTFVNLKKYTIAINDVVRFTFDKVDGLPMVQIEPPSGQLLGHYLGRSAAAHAKADGNNGLVCDTESLTNINPDLTGESQMPTRQSSDYHYQLLLQNKGQVLQTNYKITSWNNLHEVLGHTNFDCLQHMVRHGMVDGVEHLPRRPIRAPRCESCPCGKMHRRPVPKVSEIPPTAPGRNIYADIGGPMPRASTAGHRYFVLFKDKFTQHRAVYFMKTKDEVLDKFKQYLVDMQMRESDLDSVEYSVELLYTDSDSLFISEAFKRFCATHDIARFVSAPYAHAQNGEIEREMRTIGEAAVSLLHAAGMPLSLWDQAYAYAVYTKNRVWTRVHYRDSDKYKVPHERRFGQRVNVKDMIRFGAKAFVYIDADERTKMANHAWVGFFVGYS